MKLLFPLIAFALTASAAFSNDALICRESASFLAGAESVGDIKYAPDVRVNIGHVAIDVTPDFEKRTIEGQVTLSFKPIAQPLDELRLDGVDLTVSEITSSEPIAGRDNTGREIVITFAKPIPAGRETTVTIRYSAQPQEGLYFRVPSNGYAREDMHIWTQGESAEARHWFPCYDYPNAKFTSEIVCRVPEGFTVLSNGRLVSSEKDPATGLVAVRWKQEKPHVNYLITLVAGRFVKLEDSLGNLPLSFYTPPSDAEHAALTFAETKPAMEFFDKEIGVPFPWAQYGQVVVRDFTWGGMENTTLTTLTEWTLHTPATENIHTSEGLVAHELAHQWFGDLVTCKDWSHTWLNEGFATYYAELFAGHRHGRDALLYAMHRGARGITADTSPPRPIVSRKYNTSAEQFDNRAYGKGSWVLHMLRSQLGEDLFRRCIKTYLERHKFGNVVTDDLRQVIEELSGRSFDPFFDQWLYHAHFPELDVNYSWDEKAKLARITVRQQQKTGPDVLVFRFPLKVRFKMKDGTAIDRHLEVKDKDEDFYLPLGQQPQIVRIDPDVALLTKIQFTPPPAMLHAQLADKSDAIGRVIAAQQLGEKKDDESIAQLRTALASDEFFGVRIEASASLRKIHSDPALEALVGAVQQPDARVRNALVGDIAGFFHPRAREALMSVLGAEKNPAIIATAVRGLGAYHGPGIHDALLGLLRTPSFHNQVAVAAIGAMRAQDDTAYLEPLREAVSRPEAGFSSRDFGQALDALAYLGRNEKSKDPLREFIAGFINHKREKIQTGAMKALGTLEDPKAIALLESFTAMPKESPQRQEADKAIAALRAVNRPGDNLKDLRQEVLDLRRAGTDLKKELDDLKKRVEAAAPKDTEKAAGK